jgi:XTP/dITP diphosphohydrolase
LKKLLFATRNPHKLREVTEILPPDYEIESLPDPEDGSELPEDFETLHENAGQKATFIFNQLKCDCFAEDTGLEVDALEMQPGVISARFAGPERNDEKNKMKLLQLLEGQSNRKARFRTVIALIEGGKISYFEGILEGRISEKPLGAEGFGYDAVFIPRGFDRTLAEMKSEEKNNISHRRQALSKLVAYLSG